MIKGHTLSLEASVLATATEEMRLAINGMEPDAPDRETKMTELLAKQTELVAKMQERDVELEKENRDVQLAMANNVDASGFTPEQREFRDLAQRTWIGNYLVAAYEERDIREGAEFEYNKHVLGQFSAGDFPLEMLLDRTEKVELKPEGYKDMSRSLQEEDDAEHRTLVTGVGQDHGQSSFLDRIFQDSEGVYLRASYPVVGPGRHSFAIVDGTGVATVRTRTAAETPAGTITVEDADANRLQTSFEVSGVDELRMPGISNYLGGDIRMSLMAGLDNYVVDQLISGLTAVDVTSGTTLTTAGLVAAVHAEVDGRAAQFFSDIRLLAGNTGAASQTTAFSRIGALMAAVTLDGLWEWMTRIRASAHMVVASGGEDNIIAVKTGPSPSRLIVPVWRRANLKRDSGRLQLTDADTITGTMYVDVISVNDDLHTQLRVETQ